MEKSKIPPLLQEISDPPKRLYLRGQLPSFDDYVYLTVVGSRNFTSYGKEACQKLIEGLSGYPICVVSGLAVGIDSIAHQAALKAHLPTVAIPGSGLSDDVLYPRSNRRLAHEILEAGGALLSEYEPDFEATVWSFPLRNRLMAGLSKAVLVIEAEEKSGTRITARLATEYNRDVMVVPGSIFSTASQGTNALIKEGAIPVVSSEQILEELGLKVSFETEELNDQEKKIMKLLSKPMSRDQLIRISEMTGTEANVIISTMELKGLIKETLGEVRRN